MKPRIKREPKLWEALIPVILLMGLIGVSVVGMQTSAHIALVLGIMIASFVGWRLGYSWHEMEQAMIYGINLGLQACLILMTVGILIGLWILGGIVPAMINYGLKLISPSVFLVSSCIICCVVSLATGSSWSTAGTVGLALIGIGKSLGISLPMVAGAIISGAYFGDKMSPLSDTTNLAPAAAGTDLFTHIRHMVYTTGPSLAIALTLYGFLDFHNSAKVEAGQDVLIMLEAIQRQFSISPWLLIPPLAVVAMVVMRIPALPALFVGCLLGAMTAWVFQGSSVSVIFSAALDGFRSQTGTAAVDELLTRGGLLSMMPTLAMIFAALGFGGVMEKTGLLARIAASVLFFARNVGLLVTTTILTCISFNFLAAEQYISIIIPGRMYREAFRRYNLHPKNLSRCLEDSGTLSSPLVPWNTCGAFMAAVLGVSPWLYAPYAFLNLINPMVSIFYGFTGITMEKLPETNMEPGKDAIPKMNIM